MSDCELLEWAAKAYWAGEIDDVVSIEWSEADNAVLYTHADNQDHNGQDCTYVWNPLADDGDALRLAVKLKLHLGLESNVANAWAADDFGNFQTVQFAAYGEEAATRRAIVRAAAETGKQCDKEGREHAD